MKIALLSGASGIHTTRWANGLAQKGHELHLISAHPLEHHLDDNISFYRIPLPAFLAYFVGHFWLRRILKKIRPDILNAHYATGYGLMARLSGFRPLLLSILGSDIYDFPHKSFVHRLFLQKNLRYADAVASTSECMAKRLDIFATPKELFVTPFGIDEELFRAQDSMDATDTIVIGTVKTLKPVYGIDVLVRAFAKLKNKNSLSLEVTGGGPLEQELKNLADELEIKKNVAFFGFVPHEKIPAQINRLNIYVAMSRVESFGVAILEASACKKPVVVSDAEGPVEVIVDGETGIVVPKDDVEALKVALEKLIADKDLREKMGKNGREHVLKNYTWDKSIELMESAYTKTIENFKSENI